MQSGANCVVSDSLLKVVKAVSTSLPEKTNRVRQAESEGVSSSLEREQTDVKIIMKLN
jgi:hypothetical protein